MGDWGRYGFWIVWGGVDPRLRGDDGGERGGEFPKPTSLQLVQILVAQVVDGAEGLCGLVLFQFCDLAQEGRGASYGDGSAFVSGAA